MKNILNIANRLLTQLSELSLYVDVTMSVPPFVTDRSAHSQYFCNGVTR